MAGIYIHIPFCRQKCNYCNFFSVASVKLREGFHDALLQEIQWRHDYIKKEEVGSIYFGGGTPSLLSISEVDSVMDGLKENFIISGNAEITMELNPEDVNDTYIQALVKAGFNRFSVGVQSFNDYELRKLSRRHSASKAIESIKLIKASGCENLSLDLIYGIPESTNATWKRNIRQFLELDVPHLSAYALTVEEKTPLHWMIRKGKFLQTSEETAARQYEILVDVMKHEGFIHYEISNFAREGHYSKHNSLYWLGGNYVGLGPSAHSYNGVSREWNVGSISGYISGRERHVVSEKEVLGEQDKFNEYIMTSLRTIWGCDLEHVKNVFGNDRASFLEHRMSRFLEKGLLTKKNNTFFMTEKGMFLSDGIIADLFE